MAGAASRAALCLKHFARGDMTKIKATLVMAAVVIALSLLAIQQGGVAPEKSVDKFGSGTAPMAIAICLIVLSIIIVAEAFAHRGKGLNDIPPAVHEAGPAGPAVPYWQRSAFKGAGTIVLFLVFVVLLDRTRVPFWSLTSAFLFLASRVIEGNLRWWLVLSFFLSLGLGVTLDVVLTRFLVIELP